MDPRLFATVFVTVFVAELGDKTQIATLLYASQARNPRFTVFAAAASALVLTSALGVLGGTLISEWLSPRALRWIAGLGFVAVGLWVMLGAEA